MREKSKRKFQIVVESPTGEIEYFPNLKKLCEAKKWSYGYIRTRKTNEGFVYKDHKIKREKIKSPRKAKTTQK